MGVGLRQRKDQPTLTGNSSTKLNRPPSQPSRSWQIVGSPCSTRVASSKSLSDQPQTLPAPFQTTGLCPLSSLTLLCSRQVKIALFLHTLSLGPLGLFYSSILEWLSILSPGHRTLHRSIGSSCVLEISVCLSYPYLVKMKALC